MCQRTGNQARNTVGAISYSEDVVAARSKQKSGSSGAWSTLFRGIFSLGALVAIILFQDEIADFLNELIASADAEDTNSTFTPGAECANVTLGEEITFQDGDYVSLVFTACPTPTALEAFSNAAARLSAIISANPLSGGVFDEAVSFSALCSFIQSDLQFPPDFSVNNLIIFVEPVDIDGEFGTLASAGPCQLNSGFPIFGGMRFDTADLARLEADGTLEHVILHEMLHVLGVGTLWKNRDLLDDPVYTTNSGPGDPTANPRFIGALASDEYGVLGGVASDVPVEDGDGVFDVNLEEGRGSIDGHWRISTFDNELMVFRISAQDTTHPLSKMTILSLADLGYTVDVTQADAYSIPVAPTRLQHLRGSSPEVHDLEHDIFLPIGDNWHLASDLFV